MGRLVLAADLGRCRAGGRTPAPAERPLPGARPSASRRPLRSLSKHASAPRCPASKAPRLRTGPAGSHARQQRRGLARSACCQGYGCHTLLRPADRAAPRGPGRLLTAAGSGAGRALRREPHLLARRRTFQRGEVRRALAAAARRPPR